MAAQENTQRDMGNRIAKRRTELGMSQEGLAELAGMSRVSIVRIENGEQIPRSHTAERLCRVLGITMNDLYQTDPEMPQTLDVQLQSLKNGLENISIQKQQQFFQMAEVILRGLAGEGQRCIVNDTQ